MLTEQELKKLPDNPNKATASPGKDTMLHINKGTAAVPVWVLIGGQRNTPLSRKANTLDASHKASGGWGAKVPGLKDWSIEYSGLMIESDEALQILDYCFTQGKQVNIKLAYPNGSYRTGWGYITAYNDDNAHDAISTVKVTIEGNGPISELQSVPSGGTGSP